MKNYYFSLFTVLVILSLTFSSCKFTTTGENPVQTGGIVTLSGTVVESTSGNPVSSASVNIIGGTAAKIISTDDSGKFSVEVGLNQDASLTIITTRTGYDNDTTSIYAAVGSDIQVPLIKLVKQQGAGGGTSGQAASIYLYSQSAQSIGVKESGSNETVQIIFEVLDSTGVPIGSNNSVLISFSLGSSPGGGEYLYPVSMQSNALGRASVTLNTGTIAGVAQIIAEFTINDVVVRSQPVMITIYGGFPDPNHFGVASDKQNYPEFGVIGYTIPFTAFVGDKYSNPVRPGTSVYFATTSGIIGGSNVTDESGRATVTLLTQPNPDLEGYGPGFFIVTASTVDENNNHIQTSTVRLLSGLPEISVDPTTFAMENGESKLFNFIVSDENDNPLSEGQTITVKVNKGDLEVIGDVDISMLDTQLKTSTMFTFTAIDSKPDTTQLQQAVIDIETTGPNGEKKVSIIGTSK